MGYYARFLKYFAVRATINLWLWNLARCSSALIHIKQNKISANWWVQSELGHFWCPGKPAMKCRPFQTKHVGCNNKGCDSPCTKKGYNNTPSAKNKNKQEVLTIVEKQLNLARGLASSSYIELSAFAVQALQANPAAVTTVLYPLLGGSSQLVSS